MAAAANPLVFVDAEKARDAITAQQQKQISDMYQKWADDIAAKADWYGQKTTASAPLSRLQMLELEKQLREAGKEMSNQMYQNYKQNIYSVADAVVGANNSWMSSLGFNLQGLDAAFSHVPMQTVNTLITGQLYEGGWNLSSAIWSANEKIQGDLYAIMAQGLAENTPLKDIVARMSQYVQPGARNSKSYIRDAQGHRAFPKSADYNAQRLGKTLLQHSYQQALVATTKDNPFILKYQWISGPTACDLCNDRNGQYYNKNELPLDHPNGNCAMWPVMDDNVIDKLADWVNSPDGTYPEIDAFANKVGGYTPVASGGLTDLQKNWFEKAGFADGNYPKDWHELWGGLDYGQKQDLLGLAGTRFGEDYVPKLEEYFNKYLAVNGNSGAGAGIVEKVKINYGDREWLKKNCTTTTMFKNTGLNVKIDREAVIDRLAQDGVSDAYRAAFSKARKSIKNWVSKDSVSYYQGGTKTINLAPGILKKGASENPYNTIFHEMGHAIDNLASGFSSKYSSSKTFGFQKAMLQDLDDLAKKLNSKDAAEKYAAKKALNSMIANKSSSGVQDVLGAAQYIDPKKYGEIGNARYMWGHSPAYWQKNDATKEAASELFANISAAQVSKEEMEVMKQYFPRATEKFDDIVNRVLQRMEK